MKLRTYCERELWAGFFGINEDGDQPECGCEITLDLEEDSLERDGNDVFPCFTVICPKCGGEIDGEYGWEIVEPNVIHKKEG